MFLALSRGLLVSLGALLKLADTVKYLNKILQKLFGLFWKYIYIKQYRAYFMSPEFADIIKTKLYRCNKQDFTLCKEHEKVNVVPCTVSL
jgi:hypothetical protein